MNQYSHYSFGSNPGDPGVDPYNSYPSPAPGSNAIHDPYPSPNPEDVPTVRSSGSKSGYNPYATTSSMLPPPPPPSRSVSAKVLLAIGLVVLLIFGGIVFSVGVNYQNAQSNNAHATATAQVHNIATAVSGTATAVAKATASVVASHYPFSNQLVLNDPMYDNSHGNKWYEGADSSYGGSCRFTQGAFHVKVTTIGYYYYCLAGTTNFTNFT